MAEVAIGESSIDEYIEDYHDLSISYDTMHFKQADEFPADTRGTSNVLLLDESIIDKYRYDLEEIVETKTFTPNELAKYRCNPWLLSYDLYESVEYWGLLLDLNNMYSCTEFTQSKIKVYDGTLPELIDNILASEETNININQAEIDDDFSSMEDDPDDSDDDDDIEDGDD